MNLLFVPSLMDHNINAFYLKIALITALWFFPVIVLSAVDLRTGIAKSRKLEIFETFSYGLRKTGLKILEYFGLFLAALAVDFVLSYFSTVPNEIPKELYSQYPMLNLLYILFIFKIPFITLGTIIWQVVIERKSIKENYEVIHGKQEFPEMSDETKQLLEKIATISKLSGVNSLTQILSILSKDKEKGG